ncbi:hypothetical protein Ancab_016591 [Ancistrocladus abbreviatus]
MLGIQIRKYMFIPVYLQNISLMGRLSCLLVPQATASRCSFYRPVMLGLCLGAQARRPTPLGPSTALRHGEIVIALARLVLHCPLTLAGRGPKRMAIDSLGNLEPPLHARISPSCGPVRTIIASPICISSR